MGDCPVRIPLQRAGPDRPVTRHVDSKAAGDDLGRSQHVLGCYALAHTMTLSQAGYFESAALMKGASESSGSAASKQFCHSTTHRPAAVRIAIVE